MILYAILILLIINSLLLILVLQNRKNREIFEKFEKNETILRDEFYKNREESTKNFQLIRNELSKSLQNLNDSLLSRFNEFSSFQNKHFNDFNKTLRELTNVNFDKLEKINQTINDRISDFATNFNKISKENRDELNNNFQTFEKRVNKEIDELIDLQSKKFNEINSYLKEMSNILNSNLEKLREDNNKKLEKMRETVEEKLQSTLNERISQSFKIVTNQLEAVQKGLGEMRSLANGVGDLKRVLTNVKSRGTWGEVQLHAILEQILTNEQYGKNVKVNPTSSDIVEFAIKLPGKDIDNSVVWLPIDSKFPQEDYIRLTKAIETGDTDDINKYRKNIENAILKSSETISKKYINPPFTTDFAIMFLPIEGLYAEVLRIEGLVEKIQQKYRIIVAGPTNMSAILNSLRVGFRTLAIEKRSAEVWKVLSAVKTEFKKFGDVLEKVKKQLHTATNTLEQTGVRTRAMERKLKEVEELPENEATKLLEIK